MGLEVKGKGGQVVELVKRKTPPVSNEKQYMFTEFGIGLNHLSKEMARHLPPTDSRLRPDIRALDHGDTMLSSSEKARLEQKQRDCRHRLKEEKKTHLPAWFVFQLSGEDLNVRFKNTYFDVRKKGKWPDDLLCLYGS